MKKVLLFLLFLSLFLLESITCVAGEVTIKWFGHACFLIQSSQGTTILTDPLGEETGYPLPEVNPDIITISHEHFDHNYVRPYKDIPRVLRGLSPYAKDWQKVEETVKDVKIYNVGTYHDKLQGREEGKNSVFVFVMDGLRIAHLGDLGHLLTSEQIAAIGEVNVVLIPVGGISTIDAKEATAVLNQLNPQVAVPMHYRTDASKFNIYSVKIFIEGKTNTRTISGNTFTLSKEGLPEGLQIVVLNYK